MSWWRSLVEYLWPNRPRKSGPPSSEELKLLDASATILGVDRSLSTPYGPVTATLELLIDGSIKFGLRPPASTAELLHQLALLQATPEPRETILLASSSQAPAFARPYLKPTQAARFELLVWLEVLAGATEPLRRPLERVYHLTPEMGLRELSRVLEQLRLELRSRPLPSRWPPPSVACRRSLAGLLGKIWVQRLGGELEPGTARWSLQRPGGVFSVDLPQWLDLWMEQEPALELSKVLVELAAYVEEPALLLDPVTFLASGWEPLPLPRISESLQIPLATFVEMRAETTLNRPASVDGGDLVVECPHCGHLLSFLSAYLSSGALSLRSALAALYEQVYALEQQCSNCEGRITGKDFRVARYFHWLMDRGADVALQLARCEDGRLSTTLRVFAPDGRILERTPATEAAVAELAGRYLDAKAAWFGLFSKSLESRSLESLRLDALSVAFASAQEPARLEPVLRQAAASMSAPWIIHFAPEPAHPWAGPYEPLLQERRLTASVLVDRQALERRLQEFMAKAGVSMAESSPMMFAELGPHRIEFQPRAKVEEAIHAGLFPEESLMMVAQEAIEKLKKMATFAQKIREVCGDSFAYSFDRATGSVQVQAPPSSPNNVFHLPSLISKFGADELERLVRITLLPEESSDLDQCHCGAPAHVSLKMKPADWLLSEPGFAGVVCERHDRVLFAYSIDCGEHSTYLHRKGLQKLGLSREELSLRAIEQLDQNDYEIGILVVQNGESLALGIWGNNAASIGCHPALTRRALEMAGISLGPMVRLYSQSIHALIIAEAEAEPQMLAAVATKLGYLLAQTIGASGPPLALDETVELPATGLGHFKAVLRKTRP